MERIKWQNAIINKLWRENRVVDIMPELLLMSNQCLTCLANENENLDKKAKLDDFLWPWPDLDKFADKIFACIQRSSFYRHKEVISTKVQRREILKAARTSKKAKFIDDLTIAEATQIIAIRN